LCPHSEKSMLDTTNLHLGFHLSIIFVGSFQPGFYIEIFQEVNSIKSSLEMDVLISNSVRTFGLEN